MPGSDEEREQELAELLREVRALRQTIEQLQASGAARPALPPDYAVLVRMAPDLAPDYAVLARSGTETAAGPAAPELRPDYQVLARAPEPALAPEYAVLARSAAPEDEEQPESGA